VIGGAQSGRKTFDAVVVGFYDGDRLVYAGRTRNGSPLRYQSSSSRSFGRSVGVRDVLTT